MRNNINHADDYIKLGLNITGNLEDLHNFNWQRQSK